MKSIAKALVVTLAGWSIQSVFGQTVFPQPSLTIDGTVNATAIDSHGRLIFGGSFTHVNGYALSRLARLNADLTLDTTWNPNVVGTSSVGNTVDVIAVYNGSVYFGGHFTEVAGAPRNALAAVDEETGTLKVWNPNLTGDASSSNGSVNSLIVENDTLYIGGYFIAVGGQPRSNLGAVDFVNGIATSWNPNPDGPIFSMTAATDGTIYVAGDYGSIGVSQTDLTPGVAAIDPLTGQRSAWTFTADGQIYGVARVGGKVYLGGDFRTINGNAHPNAAVVDAITGVDSSWNPAINSTVLRFFLDGKVLYATGYFDIVSGQVRNSVAAFDASSGQLTGWDANLQPEGASANSVSSSGALVFLGGNFTSVHGQLLENLVALTTYTEEVFSNDFECIPTPPSFCQ